MSGNKIRRTLIQEQTASFLGLETETLGKTEARQRFLPLVSDLQTHPRAVQITEQNSPVAVLISYNHYVALISQISKLQEQAPKRKPNLMGSVSITADLDAASKRIGDEFRNAIKRSSENL